MRFVWSVLPILLSATGSLAAPKRDPHVVHESLSTDHLVDLRKIDDLHPNQELPMRIGLTQNNLDKGEALIYEVSDPSSAKYGKHYSQKEVIDLFAPSDSTIQSIRKWVESAGVPSDTISLSGNKQWLAFDATVDTVEKLLKTKYTTYYHKGKDAYSVGCDHYSVPMSLQRSIDYITPAVKRVARRSSSVQDGDVPTKAGAESQTTTSLVPVATIAADEPILGDSKCNRFVTPACIRTLYSIPEGTKASPGNEMGLYETEFEHWNQFSLDNFYHLFDQRIPNGTAPISRKVDGGTVETFNPSRDGGEVELDIEMAIPIVYPQTVAVYSVNDNHYQRDFKFFRVDGLFNTFLDALDGSYCSYSAFGETGDDPVHDPKYPDPHKHGYNHPEQCGVYRPNNVISISYSSVESELPMYYQRRQCNEWMKLALQGVTVTVASGDDGVEGNGERCLGPNHDIFLVSQLSDCPWVTVVGSTEILPTDEAPYSEVATRPFYSGGGFSNIFPQPKYQSASVESYLTNYPPPYKSYATKYNKNIGANGGIFNRAGRAYPDVAAVGWNNVVFLERYPGRSGGTSASAPIFGSIITRINEERLAAGKSVVGFINPALYANPQVLTDITNGDNPGCKTHGFNSTPGWDPVTGLGTPNYPKMLDLFMGLP